MRSDRQFDSKEWPKKLKIACFVYNTSVHRVIGLSPFEAVFGHEATLPVDLIFPLQRKEGKSWSNYVEHLKLTYQRLYKQMCEHEMTTLALDAPHYQGRSPTEYQENDLVYYFLGRISRGVSKKLQSRWIGPFKIVKKVSESLVVIKPEGSWSTNPKEIATIVSRLRKVDKDLYYSELHPSRRYQVDLPAILDDVEDLDGVIGFQPDFEDDDTPVHDASAPQPLGGTLRDYSEPLAGPTLGPDTRSEPEAETAGGTPPEVPRTPVVKDEPTLDENQTQREEASNDLERQEEAIANDTDIPSDLSPETLISDSDRVIIPVSSSQETVNRYPRRTNRFEGTYDETGSPTPRASTRGRPRGRPRGIFRRRV